MIREVGVELQAALRSRGCPLTVFDRESSKTNTNARERIVLEHDEKGQDGFASVRGVHANPKQSFTRAQALKITIYAQSPAANALEWEHRRRADHILDLVVASLEQIAKARQNSWMPKAGHFLTAEDLAASEQRGGAVYELSLTFGRGMPDVTWTYEARPEVDLSAVTNTDELKLRGQTTSPESAC